MRIVELGIATLGFNGLPLIAGYIKYGYYGAFASLILCGPLSAVVIAGSGVYLRRHVSVFQHVQKTLADVQLDYFSAIIHNRTTPEKLIKELDALHDEVVKKARAGSFGCGFRRKRGEGVNKGDNIMSAI